MVRAALRSLLDLPLGLEGEGALQAWLDADGRGAHALTVDLALDRARVRLGEALPVLALDGGPDGLAFYDRICAAARSHLEPGGARHEALLRAPLGG